MIRYRCLFLVASLIVGGLAGCGAKAIPTGKVTGSVTYKGQPLPAGSITFLPENGRSGSGSIVNGQIQDVTTLNANDGAPLGSNIVTIQSFEEGSTKDMYATPKSLIPEKYGIPEKSGLTAVIKPGARMS